MTRPSSTPRPGTTWTTQLISLGETIVDSDDGDSPFGWRDLPAPRPNRETRRAARRAARRNR
ncbi:hypothetical protein ACFZB5_13725 [Streptomyces nodosus]|uniref:hypothetical protein n=1 Tax=Streptomyces nodosus TaxID=40318 RepID=UPI0036E098E7